jgi:hypothetical protein
MMASSGIVLAGVLLASLGWLSSSPGAALLGAVVACCGVALALCDVVLWFRRRARLRRAAARNRMHWGRTMPGDQ